MESKNYNRLALAGISLAIPAMFIFSAGVLVAGFGLEKVNSILESLMSASLAFRILIHPVVVMGGLITAFFLNTIPILKVELQPYAPVSSGQAGSLVTIITAQVRLLNIGVAVLSLFLLTSLLFYAFTENFQIVAR